MTAGWLVVRAEFRARWRTWLMLALIAALFAGVVQAAAAGARRTDSAYPDLLAWSQAPDVLLFSFPGPSQTFGHFSLAAAARLPQVTQSAILANYNAATPANAGIIAPETSTVPAQFWHRKILAGRLADPGRPGEVNISFTLAQASDLGVGDVLRVKLRTATDRLEGFSFRVVGIDAAPAEFPPQSGTGTDIIWATPAFYREHHSGLDVVRGPGSAAPARRGGPARCPAPGQPHGRGQVHPELPAGRPGREHRALDPPPGGRSLAARRAARGHRPAHSRPVAGPGELPGQRRVRHAAGPGDGPPGAVRRRPQPRRSDRRGRRGGGRAACGGGFPATAGRPGWGSGATSWDTRGRDRARSRRGRHHGGHGSRGGLADLAGREGGPRPVQGRWRGGRPGPSGQRGGGPGSAARRRGHLGYPLGDGGDRPPPGAAAGRGPDRPAGAQHDCQRGGRHSRAHGGAGLHGQPGQPARHAAAVRRHLGRLREQHAQHRHQRGGPRRGPRSRGGRVGGGLHRCPADYPRSGRRQHRAAARAPRLAPAGASPGSPAARSGRDRRRGTHARGHPRATSGKP